MTKTDEKGFTKEEHFDRSGGGKRVWTYRENKKPALYQEFDEAGTLMVDRIYSDTGNEAEYFQYNKMGILLHRALYDCRGIAIKRWQWSDSGILLFEGDYLDNYKHGLHLTYSEKTGLLLSKIEYRNDSFSGLSEIYYDPPYAGILKSKTFYKGGQNDGEFYIYYPNGQLEESGEIRDGNYIGARKKYYENGILQSVMPYMNGELHGNMDEFYESGQLKRRYPAYSGKPHGIEQYFNEAGQLTSQSGHIHGEFTNNLSALQDGQSGPHTVELFHQNGTKQFEIRYDLGLRNGPYRIYNANGLLVEEGSYRNDKFDGVVSYYFPNGIIEKFTTFSIGKKNGPLILNKESGAKHIQELYSDDVLIQRLVYFENGKLESHLEMSPNEINYVRYYTDSGEMYYDCQIEPNLSHTRNLIHGYERHYGPNGKLSSERIYQSGFLQGTSKFFNSLGILKYQLDYEKGILLSKTTFTIKGQIKSVSTFFPDQSIKSSETFDVDDENSFSNLDDSEVNSFKLVGFDIVRPIGHGGMGDVYLAKDLNLDRLVAIKRIRGNIEEQTSQRFLSEGQALAKISHPNVVQIFSLGQFERQPYLVMEYVEGWPLNTLIGQGLLSLGEQLGLFKQMAEGLQAAHNVSVLHRDLKPSNILVTKALGIKIIDFGISKNLFETGESLTQPHMIMGTIKYMPPEIIKGLPATIPSDIYSLGGVFFEMLLGKPAFSGTNDLNTMELIMTEPLTFPEGVSDVLPIKLKVLIQKMMAKSVADRFQTIGECLEAIHSIIQTDIPSELNSSSPIGIALGNREEARKILVDKGFQENELSLILNLAIRIQYAINRATEATVNIALASELILCQAVLDDATIRYQQAKVKK